jgi:hypothetical protein
VKLGAVGVGKERGGGEEAERNDGRKEGCTAFYENLDLFLLRIRCLGGFLLFFFLMSFYVSFFKWEKLETGLHHDIHTLMYCTGSQGRKALLFSLRDWRTEMNYAFFAFFLGWLGLVRESFIYE